MVSCRNTVHMQKIREYLCKVKSHPNAETVFENVRKEIPSITRATVYRNLHKLADAGEILRFELNGEYRFDGNNKMHIHLFCNKCGKIMDLEGEKTCIALMKKLNLKEFMAEKAFVYYEGKCRNCLT